MYHTMFLLGSWFFRQRFGQHLANIGNRHKRYGFPYHGIHFTKIGSVISGEQNGTEYRTGTLPWIFHAGRRWATLVHAA